MKVIAVYGSGRKNGNGADLVNKALEKLDDDNLEVRKYYLADMQISPCIGCFACRKKEGCVQKDDMSDLLQQIVNSDLVIFNSPVYCNDISGSFKMMYDRLYPMLSGEPGHYTKRYPDKKSILILTQGAPTILFRGVPRRVKSNLKMNGFDNKATIVCGSANKKGTALKNRHTVKLVERACQRILNSKY